MDLKHLSVKNFRGIKNMSWHIPNGIVCLVGPGDSTKTTILDSIELALLPRWNPTFDDTDFYNCDVSNSIEITCTVGQLPEELMSMEKFGAYLRGWKAPSVINDEPEEGDEVVMTIQLTVDEHLEPIWRVISDRQDEGKEIHLKDRERLGMARLGTNVERHLSWGIGSTLTRITKKTNKPTSELIMATRKARETVKLNDIEEFVSTSAIATGAVAAFGVKPKVAFAANLDPKGANTGIGTIVMADGNIPVRSMGLGSKRLFALAIQSQIVPDGAIYLVDEIEAGLEPHRIRHLLRKFIGLVKAGGTTQGKVIMTSHSSVAIAELEAECLCVVRSDGETTTVEAVSKDLQGTVRSVADAFLAKKVMVCEGATEYGMTRSFDEHWQSKGNDSFAFVGLVCVDGQSTNSAAMKAMDVAKLGYDTALFIDSDTITKITPSVANVTAAGVKIFHWSGTVATEQEVFNCIPWEGVEELLAYACILNGQESVYDAICHPLGAKRTEVAANLRSHFDETLLRTTIGTVAHKQKWYKSVGKGQVFGNIVLSYLDKVPDTTLAKTLQQIQTWIYAE